MGDGEIFQPKRNEMTGQNRLFYPFSPIIRFLHPPSESLRCLTELVMSRCVNPECCRAAYCVQKKFVHLGGVHWADRLASIIITGR